MVLSAASALCQVFSLIIAGSPIFYSGAPRGTCTRCCALREREDIKFLLYTRLNPTEPQNIYLADAKRLQNSNFNFNNPLAVYLHGFSESATGDNQSSQQLKDAFLKAGNYNVILVDWSPITAVPWYPNAVESMPITARYIARLVRFLIANGYSSKQMHLIGFSLGAEVAGFVGKQLQEWGLILPRITGLDPPLPMFESDSTNRILGPKAARFVDIIHTDGGLLGNPESVGHADFYPNGGRGLQPGCAQQEISKNRWLSIIVGCSHQRAWEYFIETIQQPYAFPANKCEPSKTYASCRDGNGSSFMGMGADRRLRGKFFLSTNGETPFGRNYTRSAALSALPTTSAALTTTVTTTTEANRISDNSFQNERQAFNFFF